MKHRRWIKWASAALLFTATGCLQPDPSGPGNESGTTPVDDAGQLAGATSSTNWPPEDAGYHPTGFNGQADSELVLEFVDFYENPVPVSGKITFYAAGPIPALDSVKSLTVSFPTADTLRIRPESFLPLFPVGEDSVRFSILIDADSVKSLVVGFTYSVRQGKFVESPFSANPHISIPLSIPKYFLDGKADSTLMNLGTSIPGKEHWCFYIPGSPFFWNVGIDSLVHLGPLPKGNYPFRFLRILPKDGSSGLSRLEIREAELSLFRPSPTQSSYFVVKTGALLQSIDVPASLTIRPQ